jgi:L-fuconolactonase
MSQDSRHLRVDSHQHFWQYTAQEFDWINEPMAAIRRDLLPSDLRPVLDQSGIDMTVAVQARQSLEETEWLLTLAKRNLWISGVVGWVPLIDANVLGILERITANEPGFKGVRHVLQAEPGSYMERQDFNDGLSQLVPLGLAYDVLIHEGQLPFAIALADRHPEQHMVLDHVAKPRIAAHEFEPWATNIREIAKRPNIHCKLSGMITEADCSAWTDEDLEPYFGAILEAFGPSRIMFGSDWPVCLVAGSYERWATLVRNWIKELSVSEQDHILGLNAAHFYNLKIPEISDLRKFREVA